MKALYRMGRPEIADEKEKSYLAGEAQPLERAARNVQAINADMVKVHRDKTLTPESKRQRLDELIVGKNVLLKASVLNAEKAQRKKARM